jgi:hypothetical protein
MHKYSVGIPWENSRKIIEANSNTEAKMIYCKLTGRKQGDKWSGVSILTARKIKE